MSLRRTITPGRPGLGQCALLTSRKPVGKVKLRRLEERRNERRRERGMGMRRVKGCILIRVKVGGLSSLPRWYARPGDSAIYSVSSLYRYVALCMSEGKTPLGSR